MAKGAPCYIKKREGCQQTRLKRKPCADSMDGMALMALVAPVAQKKRQGAAVVCRPASPKVVGLVQPWGAGGIPKAQMSANKK